MITEGSQQKLKELALQYQSSKDPTIFKKILLRMDRLLLSIARRAIIKKSIKKEVEQDVYHATVLGLYKAILKVQEDEPENILVSKIIFYANSEINSWNKEPKEKSFSSLSIEGDMEEWPPWTRGVWSGGEVKKFYSDPNLDNLERESIWVRLGKLVEEEVLTAEEYDLIVMKFVKNMSYKNISVKMRCREETISRKIQKVLNRLGFEFRKRGWKDEFCR